ncbi:MAG: hypothetical protein IT280_06350 [Ignavibacteria bacterium]|nr:hypothetical protein [Ignavibacteria bacterium]
MPVLIKKYRGNNYFMEREFADKLDLEFIPSNGLPVFRLETDDPAQPGSYRAGDFDLMISLLQNERSQTGLNIRDFFLGEDRDYYCLVIFKLSETQSFCGIARSEQITGSYTYSQNRWHVKLTCKDILIEWAKLCDAVSSSLINFANGVQLTFEEYIIRHFSGLTGDIVLINFPQKTYLERVREIYSNIQWCCALGDYRNFITGKENISVWETFKELAKGMGFNFEMYLNEGTEVLNEPEFIFNIFFLNDLVNNTAIEPEIIEISESILLQKPKWLYLKYRSIIFNDAEYSDGIFFSNSQLFESDTNHGDGTTLYPSLALTMNGKSLSYINSSGVTEKMILRDLDFMDMPLKQYNYDLSTGRPIGKLFPLNETEGGGMAYARIFNCARVHNGEADTYDFLPVQENTRLIYSVINKIQNHSFSLKIKLNFQKRLSTKSIFLINSKKYIVNSISDLNLKNNTAEVQVSQIN